MKKWIAVLALLLGGCVTKPANIEPVANFSADKYLGKWYEIVRMDHSFEKGLSQVSAEYSLRDDGGIKVVNRGYDAANAKWKEAIGKAYFVEGKDKGFLKVSFFGPFYASYIVFELDQDQYQYSLVSGPDKSYFWLLSRTPSISPQLRERLLERAARLGFDTSKLIEVPQGAAGQ